MRIIADFHFHSRFARACSKALAISSIEKTAAAKGVHLLGTGDFTHPKWFAEIKKELHTAEPGLYATSSVSSVRFVLSAEIASIYKQGGKTRRIHTVIIMPSIIAAEKFNRRLVDRGANLSSDGRPIVGISAKELADIAFDIAPNALVIPAHIWTPWFGLFGSMSGFDTLEECFGELSSRIFAVEMGMSSDQGMNWRIAELDSRALLASSDAHSLHRIAREGNVFELPKRENFSYDWIYTTIKERRPESFLFTIKYYPQEGRYHYDGHAKCNFSCPPDKTKMLGGRCPKCGKPLTIGVLARVEELASRPAGFAQPYSIPTKHLVPLEEIVAEALGKGVGTKTVQREYDRLVAAAGGEYQVLLDLSPAELSRIAAPILTEAIVRVREERLHIEPGYDGLYGVVKIFTPKERSEYAAQSRQESLF